MKSILDRSFQYTPSRVHEGNPTYLLDKFRKMIKEQQRNAKERDEKVQPMKRKSA